MRYIKTEWIHDFEDEPIVIYSEMDEERNETRKIELYQNGKIGYAFLKKEHNDSRLSEKPLSEIDEIAVDKQFRVSEITEEDFEIAWLTHVVNSLDN